jgi:hypothetical protein
MKYAAEMGSSDGIYIPSFIRKLMGGTQHGDYTRLIFLQNTYIK